MPIKKQQRKMSKSKIYSILEASTIGKKGFIRIADRIAAFGDTSSLTIKSVVDDYLTKGITEVEVYINSAGGSVFEATEIANDLKKLPNVKIKVGALSASAATYLMTQFYSEGYPNSQFMIHRPRMAVAGDEQDLKSSLKLLENTTAEYKRAYAVKMKKTEEEIETYFAQGDYWMNAQEAKESGLLDAILTEQENVTAESVELLVAVAAPKIPQIINNNQKMDRLKLISRLKLSADATDAQIEHALAKLEAKAARTETLEASATAQAEALAEALVNKAIAEKKITADLKDNYLGLAKADYKGTETILNAMQGVSKASDGIETPGVQSTARDKWTLEDYQTKDPEALKEMMVNEPEKFKKLEAEYFG